MRLTPLASLLLPIAALALACPPAPAVVVDAGAVPAEGEGEGDEGEGEAGDGAGEGDAGEGEGDAGEGEGEGEPDPLEPRIKATTRPGVFHGAVEVALVIENQPLDQPPFAIWYTRDGSVPAVEGATSTLFTTPFFLTSSTGVRAIAVDASGDAVLDFFGAYLVLAPDVQTFSSNLPVLVFWSTEQAPEDKEEEFTPFTIMVFETAAIDPEAPARVTWPGAAAKSERAGIKVHGSSSASFPKLPWRVETWGAVDDEDDSIALLGMPKEADWILNAPLNFDRALMRNSLAFALSNAAGVYAPRTQWAEVFIVSNGGPVTLADYLGVFEVTEHIKRDANRVPVVELLPEDVEAPAVTGGYIFKEDRTGPGEAGFRAGEAGGALDFQQPFVFADPDEDEIVPAQLAYLTGYLDDVGLAVAAPDGLSPAGQHYSELVDVASFIDHHILNVFTKNPDAMRLSGYFWKDREGPVVAGPIWDFDRTMGCSADGRAADPTFWDATNVTGDTTDMFDHGFYRGLFADPAFRAAYFARMAELLDGPLSPASTTAFIDGAAARLDEAAVRNFVRWDDFAPSDTFADEVAHLRDWTAQRHAWMASCLALPDPRTCVGD